MNKHKKELIIFLPRTCADIDKYYIPSMYNVEQFPNDIQRK